MIMVQEMLGANPELINDNGKAESTPEKVCWTKIKHSEQTL